MFAYWKSIGAAAYDDLFLCVYTADPVPVLEEANERCDARPGSHHDEGGGRVSRQAEGRAWTEVHAHLGSTQDPEWPKTAPVIPSLSESSTPASWPLSEGQQAEDESLGLSPRRHSLILRSAHLQGVSKVGVS